VEAARARQNAVAAGTWDARAEWVSEMIEEALKKKAGTLAESNVRLK
jgi:hypothetical protein